jgi:hypothetical protein
MDRWCHRIFPIQETCILSETELYATVSKLFSDFLRSEMDQDESIKVDIVALIFFIFPHAFMKSLDSIHTTFCFQIFL